jgi:exosortase F-associated protein
MYNRLAVFGGIVGLILVYVFQLQLFYDPFQVIIPNNVADLNLEINTSAYILSKVLRYILNDGFALLLIWGLFGNKRYMRFAMLVFLFGLVVLLPLYLVLTLHYYASAYAFLNHLHRLVLNPVLMMLLIPAFYYQRRSTNNLVEHK